MFGPPRDCNPADRVSFYYFCASRVAVCSTVHAALVFQFSVGRERELSWRHGRRRPLRFEEHRIRFFRTAKRPLNRPRPMI